MTRQIRIPLIIDVIRTDEPDVIRGLADNRALDRGFEPRGPLLNRVLSGRVRRALRTSRKALPSALMRADADRTEAQKVLRQKFVAGSWDDQTVTALADYVRGETARPAGELAQEVIGRVFDQSYGANEDTWDAARVMEFHLRSWNPIKRLVRWLSGELVRAQNTLTRAADGNASSVHGTGIAVHNLVESLDLMRDDWADPAQRDRLTPRTAALSALLAPRTVMRAGAIDADVLGGTLKPGTLVALDTRAAAGRGMNADIAFLSDSWSACPAEAWVVALLEEVWRRAGEAPS